MNDSEKLVYEYMLRSNSPNDLVPGIGVFPYPDQIITVDSATRDMYVNTNADLDPNAANPNSMGNRIGIMKVYKLHEDGTIEYGYVADLRNLKNEPVDLAEIDPDNAGTMTLWATLCVGEGGKPKFGGNEESKDHVYALAEAFDDRIVLEEYKDELQEYVDEHRSMNPLVKLVATAAMYIEDAMDKVSGKK